MNTNAFPYAGHGEWPAFQRHVDLMKELASTHGLQWDMQLGEQGHVIEEHVWVLQKLNGNPSKHAVRLSNFSIDVGLRKELEETGAPFARLAQGHSLSTAWQDFCKALAVHKCAVEQRMPPGVRALVRAARALGSTTCLAPWELTSEEVNRVIELRPKYCKDLRTISAYIDEHFLCRATPIRPLVPAVKDTAGAPALDLAERKGGRKLPPRDALYELVRIVWAERPRNHFDRMRFLAIRLLILTGLRLNEIANLPADCICTEQLTDAMTGKPAGSVGGVSEAMYLRYFAEKTSRRKSAMHLYEKRQYIPVRFQKIVADTVDEVRQATAGLRATLQNQLASGGKHLWEFASDEVIRPEDVLSRLNRPATVRSERRFSLLAVKLGLKVNDFPIPLTAGFIEATIAASKRLKSDFREFRLDDELTIHTSDLLFLVPTGNPHVPDVLLAHYLAVSVLSGMQISVGLGVKGSALSVFGRYSMDKRFAESSINPHALRHLMNTELFRLGVSDTIITHHFGRESVAQSYEYDHRSLLERLDAIRLPEAGVDVVGSGAAEVVAKMVVGGLAEESHISKSFKRIQAEHGDEVAFEYLKANGDGFHVTPYGFCTNSFSMNPCSRHLKCFDDCRHFVASGSQDHTVSLQELRSALIEGRDKALSKPAKTAGRRNQIAHADSLIAGVDAALSATAGTAVFPDGKDHSTPDSEIFE